MVAVVVRGKKTLRAGHSELCRYLESLEAIPYNPIFGAQKAEIGLDNTYFWDEKVAISG
jgi:hypothetical protein